MGILESFKGKSMERGCLLDSVRPEWGNLNLNAGDHPWPIRASSLPVVLALKGNPGIGKTTAIRAHLGQKQDGYGPT